MTDISRYSEPAEPALPQPEFVLDHSRAALVLTDPQNDFLSPAGVTWEVFGPSITENDTVAHIGQLLEAANRTGLTIAVSPHYYYPSDHQWKFAGPLEILMHQINMFGRRGALDLNGFEGSGADFLEAYKPLLADAVVASPHKILGPESNDLVLQLRKRGISQVVLAGMAANLCLEAHLRELIETGFEVAVVRDATAGARLPEGDGYLAALTNFRALAHQIWDTSDAIVAIDSAVAVAGAPA
ncbi:MAG TPA: cysteine hydrolase [Pseudonocardia sp.]|jgi:nicotinamidase-related amidase|nr:cysteine hydrolase [Pseudonocardia sp.]